MKISLLTTLLAALLLASVSCSEKTNESDGSKSDSLETTEVDTLKEVSGYAFFGDTIDTESPMPSTSFSDIAKSKGLDQEYLLAGTINECCQKKGCWMTMDIGNGEEMMVKFKDYGFFVPKNTGGKEVLIKGFASFDTVSVDERKHLAEDAGKPKEEIDAIIEPEVSLRFTASGVAIKAADTVSSTM